MFFCTNKDENFIFEKIHKEKKRLLRHLSKNKRILANRHKKQQQQRVHTRA